MKNKIATYVAMALLFVPLISHAMNWGTEVTGVYWKMDGEDFAKSKAFSLLDSLAHVPPPEETFRGTLKQDNIGGSAVLFLEGESEWRLGAAAGFGMVPGVTYKTWETSYESGFGAPWYWYQWQRRFIFENKTNYIPVDLYVKYRSKDSKFSLFGGAGAEYLMATTEIKINYSESDGSGAVESGNFKTTFTQNKIVPHVQAGGEWFIYKWLSLNVGVKYLFSAVLDELTGSLTTDWTDSPGKYRLIMGRNSSGEHLAHGTELWVKKVLEK